MAKDAGTTAVTEGESRVEHRDFGIRHQWFRIMIFFFYIIADDEQAAHLMVNDPRRPWTSAAPETSQMHCGRKV